MRSAATACRARDEAAARTLQAAGARTRRGGRRAAWCWKWCRPLLARDLTKTLPIPTIGIGAGSGCSGQVLVLHDMLGLSSGEPLRFVRNFMDGSDGIEAAVRKYVADVKGGRFPDDALHAF